MTKPDQNLSSLEKLLLGIEPQQMTEVNEPLRKGALCPRCRSAAIDYNSLLQLECPACGFVGEGGGCT